MGSRRFQRMNASRPVLRSVGGIGRRGTLLWQSPMPAATAAPQTVPTVLLIEDSADHAILITRALEEQDLEVRVAHVHDGEAALELLFGDDLARELGDLRVIILDLRLPRVDGFSVLARIKQSPKLRCIPVVILTTSAAATDVRRAYDLHANSYLVKPTDYESFSDLLGKLQSYWITSNVQAGQ